MKQISPENNLPFYIQNDDFYAITEREWDVLLLNIFLSNQTCHTGKCLKMTPYFNYGTISKAAIQSKAINKKSVGQHFDFAVKVHGIAQKFQSGSDEEIVYKEDFKKEAQSFINSYRGLSKDKVYLAALATIEKDLHQFNGKSRKEILLSIGQ